MNDEPKKPARIKPYSARWEALANAIAREWAPPIYPCAHCNRPVVKGYCCNSCGSSNPDRKQA